jgi:protein gp37
MGDLFHPAVDTKWIDRILDVISACERHTFIVLTKRPELMQEKIYGVTEENGCRELGGGDYLPNLWLGVSVENQETADARIPELFKIPAAKRIVSYEPALGPVNFRPLDDFLDNGWAALVRTKYERRKITGH